MKLKDQLRGGIAILLSIAFLSLVLITTINFISVQRLEHRVTHYKQESDAINIGQQWLIVDLNINESMQDIQNAKVNKQLEGYLDTLNWLTTKVIANQVEIDAISHESCTTLILELQRDIELLEKRD